jgi:hypothetical protein
MAIGPEQLDDNFYKEIEGFEKIIDRNLLNAKFSAGKDRVRIATPSGMTTSHFTTLYFMYIKAGWKSVTRDYGDQRDPYDDLIFEK